MDEQPTVADLPGGMPGSPAENNGASAADADAGAGAGAGVNKVKFELDSGKPSLDKDHVQVDPVPAAKDTEAGSGVKVGHGQESPANEKDPASATQGEALADAVDGLALNEESKKKSKKKSKSQRKVTGFEEFYADPPTLPDVAREEKESLYSPHLSLAVRIEQCLQRYRASRKLVYRRASLFNSFLSLGGIDSSVRQFTGMDPAAMEMATADEIRDMTARDVIHHGTAGTKYYDPANDDGWQVDFEAVVKGCLSRVVPEVYLGTNSGSHADYKEAANVLINFLNYVQMHDVCPEYNHQIVAAKAVCEIAPKELRDVWDIRKSMADGAHDNLRGGFNRAAWFLFGEGAVHRLDETVSEEDVIEPRWEGDITTGKKLDPMSRLIVFRTAVLLDPDMSDETKRLLLDSKGLREIKVLDVKEEIYDAEDYEVVAIERLDRQARKTIQNAFDQVGGKMKFSPAGKLVLRRSFIAHGFSNIGRPEQLDWSSYPREKVYLEDDILAKVVVGMKMRLVLCELSIGIKFIKECLEVRVSFDTFLPQMLMTGWKDPEPSHRDAPSAEDLDAEPTCEDDVPE